MAGELFRSSEPCAPSLVLITNGEDMTWSEWMHRVPYNPHGFVFVAMDGSTPAQVGRAAGSLRRIHPEAVLKASSAACLARVFRGGARSVPDAFRGRANGGRSRTGEEDGADDELREYGETRSFNGLNGLNGLNGSRRNGDPDGPSELVVYMDDPDEETLARNRSMVSAKAAGRGVNVSVYQPQHPLKRVAGVLCSDSGGGAVTMVPCVHSLPGQDIVSVVQTEPNRATLTWPQETEAAQIQLTGFAWSNGCAGGWISANLCSSTSFIFCSRLRGRLPALSSYRRHPVVPRWSLSRPRIRVGAQCGAFLSWGH